MRIPLPNILYSNKGKLILNLQNFNYFMFLTVVVFIYFDGIRSNLIGGNILTFLREGSIFYLVLYTLYRKYSIKKIFCTSIICFISYHVFISLISILFQKNVEPSFVIKPLYILGAIYIFKHFEQLTKRSYNDFIYFMIKTGVIFVILNTLLYFIHIPIWEKYHPWFGRISCGYPTMDVITLAYTLILLLFYPNIPISSYKRTIFTIIIIMGMLLQFSGTGLVVLSLILFTSLIFYLFHPTNKLYKSTIATFAFFLFFSITIFSYIKLYFPNELEKGMILVNNKINILTGNISADEANTMEIREEQFNNIRKKQDNDLKVLFGLGLGDLTNGSFKDNDSYMIEDQYGINLVCYGIIGYILFLSILFYKFIIIIRNKKTTLQFKLLFLLSIMIFAANCKTLIPLVLFSNYMYFAFFYVISSSSIKYENSYRLSFIRK